MSEFAQNLPPLSSRQAQEQTSILQEMSEYDAAVLDDLKAKIIVINGNLADTQKDNTRLEDQISRVDASLAAMAASDKSEHEKLAERENLEKRMETLLQTQLFLMQSRASLLDERKSLTLLYDKLLSAIQDKLLGKSEKKHVSSTVHTSYASKAGRKRKAITEGSGNTPKKRNREGDLPCPIAGCPMKCSTQLHLSTHIASHKGQGAHQCRHDNCNRIFATTGELSRHFKRAHSEYRPYKCLFEGCNAAFKQRSNLAVHERSHTGEKPFQCGVEGCDMRASTRGNIMKHERRHRLKLLELLEPPANTGNFGNSASMGNSGSSVNPQGSSGHAQQAQILSQAQAHTRVQAGTQARTGGQGQAQVQGWGVSLQHRQMKGYVFGLSQQR